MRGFIAVRGVAVKALPPISRRPGRRGWALFARPGPYQGTTRVGGTHLCSSPVTILPSLAVATPWPSGAPTKIIIIGSKEAKIMGLPPGAMALVTLATTSPRQCTRVVNPHPRVSMFGCSTVNTFRRKRCPGVRHHSKAHQENTWHDDRQIPFHPSIRRNPSPFVIIGNGTAGTQRSCPYRLSRPCSP